MSGPGAVIKVLLAFVFVWMLMPHAGPDPVIPAMPRVAPEPNCTQHDVGTCDGLVFQAMSDSISDMAAMRHGLLDALQRVRADIKANRRRSSEAPAQ